MINGFTPRVAVVGSGYVGTVVAACFASLGHEVIGLEIDERKLAALQNGYAPFHEPGLDEMLREATASGRLSFTSDVREALDASDVLFLCVGTPSGDDGHADLTALDDAARSIGQALRRHHVLVTKSTVPVGTGRRIARIVAESTAGPVSSAVWSDSDAPVSVVSNPEFLREGSAVHDFLHPDRVVLGGDDPRAIGVVASLYRPILERNTPDGNLTPRPLLVRTALETAEMIKYASNAFLATKISFANEIANICERVGADVTAVTQAMGMDGRIGARFLDAGIGWGGSCFGKDVRELAATSRDRGYEPEIIQAAMSVNARQRSAVVDKIADALGGLQGRDIGLLGLSFKPGTDDMRDAPALDVIREITRRGGQVAVHDPMVSHVPEFPDLRHAADPYGVASEADAVVLVTDWPEYIGLSLERLASHMAGDVLVDARNVFDPETVEEAGLRHIAVGRSRVREDFEVRL